MRSKIFVGLTTALTLAIAIMYSIMLWVPYDSLPAWLSSSTLIVSLFFLWLYSLVNTFSILWKATPDTLLELIHGFSLLGVLWYLASSFGVLSLQQLGPLDYYLQSCIATIVAYFALVRTMVNLYDNKILKILRWIPIAAMSIVTGMTLVGTFIYYETNFIFDRLLFSSFTIALTSFVIALLLHFASKINDQSCVKTENTV